MNAVMALLAIVAIAVSVSPDTYSDTKKRLAEKEGIEAGFLQTAVLDASDRLKKRYN